MNVVKEVAKTKEDALAQVLAKLNANETEVNYSFLEIKGGLFKGTTYECTGFLKLDVLNDAVDYLKNILYCKNEDLINANIREKMSELGIATDVYVTINDAHFLSMEEVENLIDGDINSNLVYKLRKK